VRRLPRSLREFELEILSLGWCKLEPIIKFLCDESGIPEEEERKGWDDSEDELGEKKVGKRERRNKLRAFSLFSPSTFSPSSCGRRALPIYLT